MSWLTSISDCVANTASDQHMFNEVVAGTLNEDEVVALKGLQKAVKYLTISKWVALGLDLYADWGGGGTPTVVGLRGRPDPLPEPATRPAGPRGPPRSPPPPLRAAPRPLATHQVRPCPDRGPLARVALANKEDAPTAVP